MKAKDAADSDAAGTADLLAQHGYSCLEEAVLISIRPIAAHEWQKYREIRLRALQDAPDAFGSTWEQEGVWKDEIWSTRIAAAARGNTSRGFFAFQEDQVCGLVWCKLSDEDPGVADLYQMWVDPASRGLGVGRSLLTHALAWTSSAGMRRVRLGVTAADSPARRLYESIGFRAAGELEALRVGSDLKVQAMALAWEANTAR